MPLMSLGLAPIQKSTEVPHCTCVPRLAVAKLWPAKNAFQGLADAKATWLSHKANPLIEISFQGRKVHAFLGEIWVRLDVGHLTQIHPYSSKFPLMTSRF